MADLDCLTEVVFLLSLSWSFEIRLRCLLASYLLDECRMISKLRKTTATVVFHTQQQVTKMTGKFNRIIDYQQLSGSHKLNPGYLYDIELLIQAQEAHWLKRVDRKNGVAVQPANRAIRSC